MVWPAYGQEGLVSQLAGLPALSSATGANGTTEYSLSLQILAMMTALTVLPSLVLGMTSFTRIIIVLSILRQAMGTQQTPPNQVLIAIALFLSFFIMSPTLNNINKTAVTPYMAEQMSAEDAVMLSGDILKEFMVVNTREDALIMFKDMANDPDYESNADIPFSTLMPAFITSELKTAFQIGFLLFLPFLVIDMVIASILMSLGMMMLSP
ncbi:MAG: flagellar type III secretion system pore protein FliP, partial [Paracoccaceae bacterium]|nr:flagellar type III secretion system pore protein FliP [Paracoccaceae bacterium]